MTKGQQFIDFFKDERSLWWFGSRCQPFSSANPSYIPIVEEIFILADETLSATTKH